MTTIGPQLIDVLAEVVLDLIAFAELAGDDEIHPDTALKLLESTLAQLDRLGASDRMWFYERVKAAAREEAHPGRRAVLEWLGSHLLEETRA